MGGGSLLPQRDKDLERLLRIPSDYTYNELKAFLGRYGFKEYKGGATGGSRRRFYRESDKEIIFLHKSHPGNIVNKATIRDVITKLKECGDIE